MLSRCAIAAADVREAVSTALDPLKRSSRLYFRSAGMFEPLVSISTTSLLMEWARCFSSLSHTDTQGQHAKHTCHKRLCHARQ